MLYKVFRAADGLTPIMGSDVSVPSRFGPGYHCFEQSADADAFLIEVWHLNKLIDYVVRRIVTPFHYIVIRPSQVRTINGIVVRNNWTGNLILTDDALTFVSEGNEAGAEGAGTGEEGVTDVS